MEPPTQENQHEFFPDFVKPSERKTVEPRASGIGRTHKPILFTTTIEQILFAAIVAILVLCAVYFLGILRGKSLASGRPQAVRTIETPRRPQPAPPAVVVRPAAAPRPTPSSTRPAAPQRAVSAPVAAVSPVRQAAPAPVPGKRLYTIQVVTHKKRAFAESELAAITKAGFNGKVVESDGYFIVCVGQYAAKDDAQRDLSFLRTKYSDCFLRRL